MTTSSEQEIPLLTILQRFIKSAEIIKSKGEIKLGRLKMWSGGLRSQLKKIYNENHEITEAMSPGLIRDSVNPNEEFEKRLKILKNYMQSIEKIGINAFLNKNVGPRIIIGHGQSPMWRELKDFINDWLALPWDEFNREAVAGITTFDRISDMLDSANFAFLIMTAEDQHPDEKTHSRQNVVQRK